MLATLEVREDYFILTGLTHIATSELTFHLLPTGVAIKDNTHIGPFSVLVTISTSGIGSHKIVLSDLQSRGITKEDLVFLEDGYYELEPHPRK